MFPRSKTPRAAGKLKKHKPGTMNAFEEDYSRVLAEQVHNGEIASFMFESVKLVLAERTSYMPDFMVLKPDGIIEFHEVKGFPTDSWKVKWKCSVRQFPMFTFVLVTRKNKSSPWVITVEE